MAGPKKQDFWPKINILKGNHCILRIRGAPVHQKLGMILENKLTVFIEFNCVFSNISNLEKSKNHHASLKYVYVDFRFIVDTDVTYILKPLR